MNIGAEAQNDSSSELPIIDLQNMQVDAWEDECSIFISGTESTDT